MGMNINYLLDYYLFLFLKLTRGKEGEKEMSVERLIIVFIVIEMR